MKDQLQIIREVLQLAKSSHGVLLTSYPPQDAWKFHRVDERITEALTALAQIEQAVGSVEPVACERCEELGHDKATYFRLYEQACIELQQIKKQTPAAAIKVAYSSLEGERVEVLWCELGKGVHKLYAAPPAQQLAVPEGYALIGIDALKAWGVYEQVRDACQYPVAQQAEAVPSDVVRDVDLALDLLAKLFDAYENGTPCFEDADPASSFVGHAFNLDNDTFHACADLLNRRRPVAAMRQGSGA